jgi:hypothetical protein
MSRLASQEFKIAIINGQDTSQNFLIAKKVKGGDIKRTVRNF